MNTSIYYVLIISFLIFLPLKYFAHISFLTHYEQFAVVIQHPTVQLMNKRHVTNSNQITLLSQYHERKCTGGERLLCKLQHDIMDEKY